MKRLCGESWWNCEDDVWESWWNFEEDLCGKVSGIMKMKCGEICWNCEEDVWGELVEL